MTAVIAAGLFALVVLALWKTGIAGDFVKTAGLIVNELVRGTSGGFAAA